VKAQDELEVPLYNRGLKVRVLALPEGNVKKADQWALFEVLEDKRLPLDLGYSDEDPFSAPPKPPRNH
jgi:ribosomal 50S subunit-recycling heat shock protein